MLPVSELPLLVEQKVCGVEISDLPCLASGRNLNLTSDDMADIQHQGIDFDNDIDPKTKNYPSPKNALLKTGIRLQLEI